MKTFKDLKFKKINQQGFFDVRPEESFQAILDFENGYGISVIKPIGDFGHKYCHADKGEFEVGKRKDGNFIESSDSDATEGVFIHLSQEKVEELLERFQKIVK